MDSAKPPPESCLAVELPVELLLDILSALEGACKSSLEFQRNSIVVRSVCRSWSELPLSFVVVDEKRLSAFEEAVRTDSEFVIGIRKVEIAFGNAAETEPTVAGLLERAICRCMGLRELKLVGNSVESTASIFQELGKNEDIRVRRLVLDPLKHTYWVPFESLQGLFSQSTFASLEMYGNSYIRESDPSPGVPRSSSQLKDMVVSGSSSILGFTQVLEASSATLESFSLSGIRRDWRYNQYTMILELLSACGGNLRRLHITDHFCAGSTPPYIERLIPSLPLLTTITLGTTGYTAEIFPLLSKLASLRSLHVSISLHLTTKSDTTWPFLDFLRDRPSTLQLVELEDPIGQPRISSRARDFEAATLQLQREWFRVRTVAMGGGKAVSLVVPDSWARNWEFEQEEKVLRWDAPSGLDRMLRDRREIIGDA